MPLAFTIQAPEVLILAILPVPTALITALLRAVGKRIGSMANPLPVAG